MAITVSWAITVEFPQLLVTLPEDNQPKTIEQTI